MNTTTSNRSLPHTWAHQLDSSGKGYRNVSFEGKQFFSYSTCIAEILDLNGERIFLVSETSYSVTTSKHQSFVRQAIPSGATVLPVWGERGASSLLPWGCRGDDITRSNPALKKWALELFSEYLKRAAECQAKAARARSRSEWLLRDVAQYVKHAETIKALFKLRNKLPDISKLADAIAKAEEKARKAERARQKRLEAEKAEKIAQWIAGESVSLPYRLDRVYFRANADKTQIETSKGVTFPYLHGKRAFAFCQSKRADGWRRNGKRFPIGDFQIDSISADGVVAGCHSVKWPEIEAFAKAQGWEIEGAEG